MDDQMAYALFNKCSKGIPISAQFETPNAHAIRNLRSEIFKTRPPSIGPRDTLTEVAKLEKMLNHISSDCDYKQYRDMIWSIESLNWQCGYELAYNWSITAPHRFNKQVLDRLIEDYKPGHFGYGTIMMYAKQAGWDEEAWIREGEAKKRENAWRERMTYQEKVYKWTGKLSREESEIYYEKLKIKYNKEIAEEITKLEPSVINESKFQKLFSANELKALAQPDYLVKGILPATGISACYGASGSGKTFLVTDLGINLSLGVDWYGRKAKKCPVTFVVLEGSGGLSKRLQAWEKHFGETIPDTFKVFVDSFSLMNSRDITELVTEIKNRGQSAGLVVIDTLNQASPGADENSSKDMGLIIQNAQRLARETNCHVMLVHHTGKDASKGLRGHSSLIAALDVAIEVKREGSRRSWSVNKSKDDIDTGQYHFELNQIFLGHDQDGDQISSCVIEPAIQTLISSKQKRPQGAQQKIALDTFNSLMLLSKQTTPSIESNLKLEVLEKAVGGNLAVEEKRKPERARAAINGLIALGLLTIKDGFITNT